jgi:hypothetical protein
MLSFRTLGLQTEEHVSKISARQAANSVRQPAGVAHTVSKPSAIPVAVQYARIVSTASRLRQNSGRTVMTPRPGQRVCALFATEPFTRRGHRLNPWRTTSLLST